MKQFNLGLEFGGLILFYAKTFGFFGSRKNLYE